MKIKDAFLICAILPVIFNCPYIALADDTPLQEQQAKTDNTPPPPRPMLNGNVSAEFLAPKQQEFQQESLRDVLRSNTRQNIFLLRAQDAGQLTELMSEKPTFSKEQFRKMEYGVTGFISVVTIGTANPIVSEVIPGCPAAQAGIKVGDVLVAAGEHVFQVGDGQRTVWKNVGGKAGTTVEIKLLRNGELLNFKLIRMNFEDIPDPNRRRMYELYLSRFGPPSDDQ